MTEIKTWVRRIEREEPPDLWDRVLRRAPRSDAVPWSDGSASPATGWRKAAVIATAAALSIGAIGFLALALRTAPAPQVDSVPEVAVPDVPRWTFAPAQGWEVAETPLRPAPVVLFAWTASVPFDERDLNRYPSLTGFPLYTLRSLPADGVVLTVHQYNPVAATPEPLGGISNIPKMTLPLNLDDAKVRRPVAEEPGRPMTVYDINGVIDGEVVNVTAYIGTNDPSQATLANAQDALTRLTLIRGSGSSESSASCMYGFLDPDCPDHDWLVAVLESAGLRPAGSTGTALLAESDSLLLSAWIAASGLPVKDDFEVVAGTKVYWHDEDTAYWMGSGDRQVVVRVQTRDGHLDRATLQALVSGSLRD